MNEAGRWQGGVHVGVYLHRFRSHVQLDNVTIGENMVAADGLAVESAAAPDAGTFELVFGLVVDAARELGHSAADGHGEWRVMSGGFAGLLRVNRG